MDKKSTNIYSMDKHELMELSRKVGVVLQGLSIGMIINTFDDNYPVQIGMDENFNIGFSYGQGKERRIIGEFSARNLYTLVQNMSPDQFFVISSNVALNKVR